MLGSDPRSDRRDPRSRPNANQRRRDTQPQPFFFRNVRMGHRRRMRSKSLRTTQAHRELDHFKLIQDGKGFGLTSLHFEAESGAWTLALALEDWTIGMALRQEAQIPDRCDLRMSIEEGCDLARAFRSGPHSEFQGFKRPSNQPVCGSHIVPRIVRMPRIGSSIEVTPEHPPA